MDVDKFERFVRESVKEGPWSEERELAVPCTVSGAGVRSPDNSQGFYLVVSAPNNTEVNAFVYMNSTQPSLLIRGHKLAVVDFCVTAKAREDADQILEGSNCIFLQGTRRGWTSFFGNVSKGQTVGDKYQHGKPATFKFFYKTRLSKLHWKCVALVRFYAGSANVDPETATIDGAWRFFREQSKQQAADVLRECLARSFSTLLDNEPEWFDSLTCSELESIISHDWLYSAYGEMSVLKAVIDWARHKSGRAGGLAVGDEVRIKSDCEHDKWRNADCVVEAVDDANVTLKCIGKPTETISMKRGQVLDADTTGMQRLLPHVRCAFLELEDLRTKLSNEQISYAAQFQCYFAMVRRTIEVRTGGRSSSLVGKQKTQRELGWACKSHDNITVWLNVLTHFEDTDKLLAERIRQKQLFTLEEVDNLVAERLQQMDMYTSEDVEKLIAERMQQQGESAGEVVDKAADEGDSEKKDADPEEPESNEGAEVKNEE
jgi:hypothetical protein